MSKSLWDLRFESSNFNTGKSCQQPTSQTVSLAHFAVFGLPQPGWPDSRVEFGWTEKQIKLGQ